MHYDGASIETPGSQKPARLGQRRPFRGRCDQRRRNYRNINELDHT